MSDRDSKSRFSNRVAAYIAGRPSYPLAVIDELVKRIAFAPDWIVADVGAGTGISSKLFLENGNAVTAIEPNEAMLEAAIAALGPFDQFQTIAAPAEATTLPDHSVDLIVAAQAFHWFDHDAFARECLRVLTPRGRVLLMWNNVQFDTAPFAKAYQTFMRKYSLDLNVVEKKWRDSDITARRWFALPTYIEFSIENPQPCTLTDLQARVASSSYMPHRDHPRFDEMIAELNALFDAWQQQGQVVLPQKTQCYLGIPKA